MKLSTSLILLLSALTMGCDQISQQLGLDEAQRKEAKADAEGKAVGSGCRQSGRAIEDCYSLYRWLPKASIFAGWKEMNDYMQANNIAVVEPKLPPAPPPEDKKKKAKSLAEGAELAKTPDAEQKAADKTGAASEKAEAKPAESKGESTPAAKKDEKAAAKH